MVASWGNGYKYPILASGPRLSVLGSCVTDSRFLRNDLKRAARICSHALLLIGRVGGFAYLIALGIVGKNNGLWV